MDADTDLGMDADMGMDADTTIYYFKQYFFIETKVLMKKLSFWMNKILF